MWIFIITVTLPSLWSVESAGNYHTSLIITNVFVNLIGFFLLLHGALYVLFIKVLYTAINFIQQGKQPYGEQHWMFEASKNEEKQEIAKVAYCTIKILLWQENLSFFSTKWQIYI